MIGLGNHEQDHIGGGDKDPSGAGDGFHPKWGNYGSDSGGECGVPMYKRFHMPDDGHAVWWYVNCSLINAEDRKHYLHLVKICKLLLLQISYRAEKIGET